MNLRHCRRFAADSRGAVAIATALLSVILLGFVAIAVDIGFFYFQKRDLQTYTDLAAIAAAQNLATAQQTATSELQLNGYPAGVLQSVATGIYSANSATPAAQRFQAQASGANAVLVTTQATAPVFFSGVFRALASSSNNTSSNTVSSSSGVTIGAQAVAMQQTNASFAIGSSLLTVNGGLLNSLLGSLLGGSLSLSAMSYQSLVSANIDMFSFSNALATRANLTGVTYNSLANSNVTVGQVFGAMLDAAQASSGSNATEISALTQIAALEASSSTVMQLNSLINYGPYAQNTVGSTGLIGAAVSALDLVSAAAQVANGQHQITTTLNAGVPGIASASLQLAIGERPVGTSWVTVGSAGASVHTAQTRVLLTVAVGQVLGVAVNLPIYIEIASGTATLNAIQCPSSTQAESVTLGVTPGIVSAFIGNVSNVQFNDFTTAPSPGPATILNVLGLVTVTGSATASIANMQATPVTFTAAQISAGTKQTVSTTDYISSLLSSLIGGLHLTVNVIGLPLLVPANLSQTVAGVAAAAVSPIDQVLASLLGTLGVGLGNADTWVMGVNCNHAVLVN
ncbi:pilus assembly protein TadG-related protein [Methylocapsa sp. S129]|uniref:pilus assembly protein TadG-related protein n=1 Tax=Methylocapsa sp. S129 TaxID=1641869 RepID=UPI00131E15C8|nr:pilus assembly protein TadG-related protein [Methylocapsa sp. S129]